MIDRVRDLFYVARLYEKFTNHVHNRRNFSSFMGEAKYLALSFTSQRRDKQFVV